MLTLTKTYKILEILKMLSNICNFENRNILRYFRTFYCDSEWQHIQHKHFMAGLQNGMSVALKSVPDLRTLLKLLQQMEIPGETSIVLISPLGYALLLKSKYKCEKWSDFKMCTCKVLLFSWFYLA